MSTLTGRQLEFETVDLEALREVFRDQTDKEQAKAEKASNGRDTSTPKAENTPEDRTMSAPKAENAPEDRIMSAPKGEEAPERRAMSVPDAAENNVLSADVPEPAVQEDFDPVYLEMVISQLSKRYEDKHRMSVELSSDVFTAIGKAKARARQDHEEAQRQAGEASAVVDDATRKLRIIEERYEKMRNAELLVKRELQSLPYVAEAAITETRKLRYPYLIPESA